ncbi:MAG: hypothetical protein H8F28_17580 [Fibrella sp.]|nr:hypothetical protein [Armatimonadota bacterium]
MILRKQLVAAGLAALVAAGTVITLPSQTAQAQADQYERVLASIRLNSKATSVLKAYGNPNDVVVGDVGIREAPAGAGQAGTQAGGAGGLGAPGAGRGGATPGGGRGSLAGPGLGGGTPPGFGGPPPGFGGPPPGFGGAPAGFGGDEDRGGAPGGFPGASGGGGFPGAGGSGTGQFGQTVSNLTPQQETTWIYNRRAGKDVVSYEFLVGQGGAVTQIRTIGYAGGNIRTKKGVQLGTTYKDVVLRYGVPEEQFRVGRSLIASYKNRNHVLFQFLNQRGQQENPYSAGNKVIAITIASVE